MIEFIKDDPFMALMVLFICFIATLGALMSIINLNAQTCQEGFVWVDTPQGKGCVSEYVWKDVQE